MTNFIDGGLKQTLQRRWITGSTEEMENVGKHDRERIGKRGAIARNFVDFMKIHKKHLNRFYVPKGRDMMYMSMGQVGGGYPGFGLFLATIVGQSSPEQIGWWLPRTYTMGITGSYSQTELGTGSNVRGLATTAEYDKSTQEFVLNTPTLASMKWWPSSLTTSTHTVLYAQLLIDGKEYGVHPFFLQVRDENLNTLPGVEVLDLGTKVGENEVDIGLLRLRDVRIPRRHLFEKRQHVEPDGTYVKHDLSGENGAADSGKGHYLTMITARVSLVSTACVFLSKGATIAIRYSAVRRQGFVDNAKGQSYRAEQNKIIDYNMNRFVLLRNLALAFAIRFTSNWLTDCLDTMQNNPAEATADISELHASAAGLKGYCCNATALGLEELRKACGGAGYLKASGIAALEADYKWRATAEGDTTVMQLETAKYLMRACERVQAGENLTGLSQALNVLRDPSWTLSSARPEAPTSADALTSVDVLLEWFRFRAVAQVKLTKDALDARIKAGETFNEAWKALTLRAVYTGQSYVLYFMLSKFAEMIRSCENAACKTVLERLCALFALGDMAEGRQWHGLFDIDTATMVEEACSAVCAALRPDAVALVDAWDYTDAALGSTIGAKDGNIYERQFLAAVESDINQAGRPEFLDVLEEFVDKDFLALHNKPDPSCDPDDTSSYPPPASKL
ncbi:Peroxisomal acyl-coenzyme A oxidase 1 [Hondaea fermentalgiana]|uniref:Acyl-coenzyme A oxidase n=1 Tax=Hondaea fermentalgiana TaxID=2315210 RepID=A0A2R5GLW4_9STRA|nr:Peroxisomal acyl-coenzyme A oxidase 1 [Hondaea fermentalgiana]|eukprot:GBG31886.1 Peroxisomal acyl-coenzyme A oxidase 1 [Hondaea fermentalgiana]